MKDEYIQNTQSVGAGWTNWFPDNTDYDMGECVTPYGIVSIYRQDHDGLALTILQIASGGRFYDRRYERQYSRQWTVTLARRFAEYVDCVKELT